MFNLASFRSADRPGKCTIIIILVFLFAFLGVTPSASEPQARASEIKAAFLYNFAKFVEWPPGTFADDRSIITFGILPGERMGQAVEALQGKEVKGRKIVVKRCLNVEEMAKCQLFFTSTSNKSLLIKIFSRLKKYPVLTVTDEVEDFDKVRGIINLTLVDDKIRFSININNAENCGLKISSQLLKLCTRVYN